MPNAENSVVLRNVTEADLPIFYEQQLDPEATAMAAFPSRQREPFMAHWAKVLRDESVITQTILYNGQVAGNIVSFEVEGETEVGYWMGKSYWGKGIATWALAMFLKQVETRPLYAHVAKHNLASARVLQKCGFAIIGEDINEDVEEWFLKLDSVAPPLQD